MPKVSKTIMVVEILHDPDLSFVDLDDLMRDQDAASLLLLSTDTSEVAEHFLAAQCLLHDTDPSFFGE